MSTCIMGLPTDHRAFIKLSKKYGVLTACLALRGNEIAQPVYKQMMSLEAELSTFKDTTETSAGQLRVKALRCELNSAKTEWEKIAIAAASIPGLLTMPTEEGGLPRFITVAPAERAPRGLMACIRSLFPRRAAAPDLVASIHKPVTPVLAQTVAASTPEFSSPHIKAGLIRQQSLEASAAGDNTLKDSDAAADKKVISVSHDNVSSAAAIDGNDSFNYNASTDSAGVEAAKALGKGKDANSGVFKIQAVADSPPKAARHARRASQVPTAFSDGALPGQLPTMVEGDKADSQQAQQLQVADSIEPKTGEAALTPAPAAGSAGAAGSQDASGAAPASAPAQQPKKATFVVKIKTALSGFLCCGRKSCRTVE